MRAGWKTMKLDDACFVDYGTRVVRKRDGGTIYPVYGGGGATFRMDTYNREDCLVVARFAMSQTCTRFVHGKFFLNDSGLTLRAKDKDLSQVFLDWIITSKNDLIYSFGKGSAQKNLDMEDFRNMEISFPISLPEQKRIVDILDQEFAKIDALKANAEKSLQAAKNLFSSALSSELRHRAGWKETKIGDFCEIIRGKRFVRADMVEQGVPCIHYGDIYTHYGLYATKAKGCVSPDLAKKLRFAHKNDVIVVAAGENRLDIGVGVAWLGDEPAVVHDACFILKHSQNPMFLSFYFRSAEYHQYLKDEVNEGKICSFLTKPLAEARISLPSLVEQEQIVKRLIIVSNNCTTLQQNYQKTLALCDDLKQAILRKAFNGEL